MVLESVQYFTSIGMPIIVKIVISELMTSIRNGIIMMPLTIYE